MNKIKISYKIVLTLFCSLLISCNEPEILTREKMVDVLYDIQLAEAIFQSRYNEFATREQKDALINDILLKHDITQSELDSSLIWYSDRPEIFMRINDSVISLLKSDIKLVENKIVKQEYNTIIKDHYFLSYDNPMVRFEIDSLQIRDYDNFELKFTPLGTTVADSIFELSVTYMFKDTLITDIQIINKDISYQSKNPIPSDSLKSIFGYFYIDPIYLKQRNILIYDISLSDQKN